MAIAARRATAWSRESPVAEMGGPRALRPLSGPAPRLITRPPRSPASSTYSPAGSKQRIRHPLTRRRDASSLAVYDLPAPEVPSTMRLKLGLWSENGSTTTNSRETRLGPSKTPPVEERLARMNGRAVARALEVMSRPHPIGSEPSGRVARQPSTWRWESGTVLQPISASRVTS